MLKCDMALFNSDEKRQLTQKINQALRINNQFFALSVAEVEQVLDSRRQALIEHHLIDFSLTNTLHCMEQIAKDRRMSKSEYVSTVEILQESFYYLHSLQSVEDEKIWSFIWAIYEEFDGNLEYVQGYIEDFPEVREVDGIDGSTYFY